MTERSPTETPGPEGDGSTGGAGGPGSGGGAGAGSKVAVTFRACVIETMQVPVPEHAPDHPEKTSDPVGVAVSVTDVASM